MDDEINFSDYYFMAKKNFWLILIIFIIVMSGVLVFTFYSKPVYEGVALLEFNIDEQNSFLLGSVQNTRINMQTQLAVLSSSSVLNDVYAKYPGDYLIDIQLLKDSNVVMITAPANDPFTASDIANSVAESYIDYTATEREYSVGSVKTLITDQLSALKTELDNLRLQRTELELKATTEKSPIDQIEYNRLKTSIATYQNQIDKTQLQIIELENKEYTNVSRSSFPSAQEYETAKKKINDEIKSDNAKYEGLKKSLEQYQATFNSLNSDLLTLERKYDKTQNKIQYQSLEQNIAAKETLYSTLLSRREEVGIVEKENSMDIKIIQRAVPTNKPVKPNIPLNIFIGIILGIMTGFGVAFSKEYIRNTFKSVEEIEKTFGPVIIGKVPIAQSFNKVIFKVGNKKKTKKYPFISIKKNSEFAESMHMLRTNVLFYARDKNIKIVSITSPTEQEGKSTTCANLALSLAESNIKTLLVDANIRNPTQNSIFNIPQKPGLSEVILGQSTLGDVIHMTKQGNLDIIPAGSVNYSPSRLFGSNQMKKVIETIKKMQYQIIIFDNSSLNCAESTVMARDSDASLFVIALDKTKKDLAVPGKNALDKVNVNIMGVVVTFVK